MSSLPLDCDLCGEWDRVETVVVQISGKKAWRRRLCRDCQTLALVAITSVNPAGRNR